jgi:hypothetical protein
MEKKSSVRKFVMISFGHFWVKFVLVISSVDNCSHCLPPVSTTLAKMVEKFATVVVNTGGAP